MLNNIPVLFFSFLTFNLIGQNLVNNPSFEELESCANKQGEFNAQVVGWSSPTKGTTDVFNTCSEKKVGVPKNFKGNLLPYSGKNYAGAYFYSSDNYREYLQGTLNQKLEKGKEYNISFYTSIADKSDLIIKDIGILFLKDKFNLSFDKVIESHLIKYTSKNIYSLLEIRSPNIEKLNWKKVEINYLAKGFEENFIIGNFTTVSYIEKEKLTRKERLGNAYYYIDEVSIELVKKDDVKLDKHQKTAPLKLDKSYVLKEVLFVFDKDELLEKSKKHIFELYKLLEGNRLNLIINGYTDNEGEDLYNKKLSTLRAKAVVDFLLEKGISEERLFYKGYGKSNPIADNNTEEGREKNRRVEFVLIKHKPE